jgi:SAM-dependent methyltransferase
MIHLRGRADVADVGCGAGAALIKLAKSWPAGTYVGYYRSPTQIALARQRAADAGLTDRVRFEVADVRNGLPGSFDVITTFDVVHDAVDPLGLLVAIHRALRPDGRYVCLDVNCSARPEDNTGPLGTLLYGFSIHYCMTVSLAERGAGLGTLGLHLVKLEELAHHAGFSAVRLVELDNLFNNLYELTP